MPKRRRAVLLCGHGLALRIAVARALAEIEVPLLLQAAPDEVTAARRVVAAVTRRGASATLVAGELGGDAASRRLIAAAWAAARAIDALVICVQVSPHEAAREPALDEWQTGLASPLRDPFFLAKHGAQRLRRGGGGRLIVAIDAPARGAGPLATVVRNGLLCMVEALAKAVPNSIAVSAVVGGSGGGARDRGVEIARGVGFLVAGEARPNGTVLELGTAARRG